MKVINELLQVEKSIISQSKVSAQILKTLDHIVSKRNYTVTFSDQKISLVASNNYRLFDTIVVRQNLDMMNIEITDNIDEMGNETVIGKIISSSKENRPTPLSVYSYRNDNFFVSTQKDIIVITTIVGISLHTKAIELDEDILLKFKTSENKNNVKCVYWQEASSECFIFKQLAFRGHLNTNAQARHRTQKFFITRTTS